MRLTPLFAFIFVNLGTRVSSNTMHFEFVVALLKGREHYCSGTIISHRAILTAATCVLGLKATNITVVAGIISLNDPGYRHSVSKIIKQQPYGPHNRKNDIAVLILSENIEDEDDIRYARLTETNDLGGTNSTAYEWSGNHIVGILSSTSL